MTCEGDFFHCLIRLLVGVGDGYLQAESIVDWRINITVVVFISSFAFYNKQLVPTGV